MGDAVVLGPFRTAKRADARADQVWRRADSEHTSVQAMVVPIAGNAPIDDTINAVQS
jgi:hypothetical protein